MKTDQHAYRLAPWRKQVKGILSVLLFLIGIFCVTMIYLSYSAQLTKMKLDIQTLHAERSELSRTIADMIMQEGQLTAFAAMETRARRAGYFDINFRDEETYTYLLVPGFTGEYHTGLDSVIRQENIAISPIKPEYSQSLQQWISENVQLRRVGP